MADSQTQSTVTLTKSELVIPTYLTQKPEKNPMFLEKRVYQGSSGKVYPFPVVEKILDKKVDRTYQAIILENQYLQVTFLPELGGRIYRALDKTNNYDFVYYNHVIKPALVGLTGSWISGGIEFNWPQHHRPDTFQPIEHHLTTHEDGSKTLWMSDVDRMYGTRVLVGFTMFPDKAYLKLTETFSNPTDLPQTFLWWANPAVPVNDHTQSIFPPDVHAVFDHGKRAVSNFPIATGEYYKMDYSAGVDISRYKNVPVPTSYMAAHSNYDFLGNYDYQKAAGLLHVADHHTSPGKKQWTWGNGDFGQSWDHQLTDTDGPYIELMVGTFTDNQPDFTWLKPHESKQSVEYFMPYKGVGAVKNATIQAAVNLEKKDDQVTLAVYSTAVYPQATIKLYQADTVLFETTTTLSPQQAYTKTVAQVTGTAQTLKLVVYDVQGAVLVSYQPEAKRIEPMPEAAQAIAAPADLKTNDALYFAGQHLEQYRHATYRPEAYYLEGLRRDPTDYRLNDAYGLLLYRRGQFQASEAYFKKAIAKQTTHNGNPYNGASYYHLGISLFKQARFNEAYDAFYKATWSYETQATGFLALAKIESQNNAFDKALAFINQALNQNYQDLPSRFVKVNLLQRLGRIDEAKALVAETKEIDILDFGNLLAAYQLEPTPANKDAFMQAMNGRLNNYLELAQRYIELGNFDSAAWVLAQSDSDSPLRQYYLAYIAAKQNQQNQALAYAKAGAAATPDYVFPNRLFDVVVLDFMNTLNPTDGLAAYYLGNLYYDRKQYDQAITLWEKCVAQNPDYAMAYRNLSIAYFNQQHNAVKAEKFLTKALTLDPDNARLVFELDTLYEKRHYPLTQRLEFLESHLELVKQRDDSLIQYVTLLNESGSYQKAFNLIMGHLFHPWEGGEGKVSTQYEYALVELAKIDLQHKAYQAASDKLQQALVYPRSLGEGKLPIAQDNIIDYYLGLAYQGLNQPAQATQYLQQAAVGLKEPTDMMYYNDQPADTIFYQGLALEALQQTNAAKAKYHKLIDFGEKHLFDKFKLDYFAVSLPDALLFDEDYQARNSVHCYYLMGLGYLGLNQTAQAQEMFQSALKLDNLHQGVLRHQNFKK
ncbi:DUF5107 domain-containing protein [Agrilactobacillus yilanensis]|uniref:DUF5107 domain-containing protein n=1 Tax=Agrilactobacillus yilanensis TaxID=2485997 RepID=A0ABW4J2N7_9LACO|nr:DUF5107 domain-containing protein [Agrilactobacillus yilanensis]